MSLPSRLTPVTRARLLLAVPLLGALWLLLAGPSLGSNWARVQAFMEANPEVKVPWELDVNVGIQLAACGNIVLLSLLLLTCGWWLRPWVGDKIRNPKSETGSSDFGLRTSGFLSGKGLWWCLLGIVALGTVVRLPLASKSLWWDELWSIRQCSHGSWREDPKAAEPGTLTFSPASWKRCAYYYQKPTNHVPMSLLQKASLDLWRAFTGAPRHEFSDLAARLPALLLSALGIALAGWLLHAWGAPPHGVLLGAALLALHPMAVRYGVDARGYALVMPLALSALLVATRLLRRAGRDTVGWVWLALNQCVWLWAFPHGVLDVLVMTLTLGLLLALAQANWRDRVTVWLRLVFAHILSGLLFLQLFLPNVMQARHWAGQENQGHILDAAILKNTLAQLFTGLRWKEPGAGTDMGAGLRELSTLLMTPWAGVVLLSVLGIWLLWGIGKALRAGRRAVWLAAGLLVSSAVFAWLTWKAGLYYYPRFAIALVPVIALGLGLGWQRPTALAGRIQSGVLAVLVFVFLAGGQVLLTRPIEPVRDVTDWLAREGADRGIVLAYGHGREAVMVLLPEAVPVEDDAQILAAMQRAGSEGKPLHLVAGHLYFNRTLLPKGFPVFEDPARFTEAARFDGIEAENHYRIYRFTGGTEAGEIKPSSDQ